MNDKNKQKSESTADYELKAIKHNQSNNKLKIKGRFYMNHKLDDKTKALNHIAHYLKTIAFNTSKIDVDLRNINTSANYM